MVISDNDAWIAYPNHRQYYNKLWLSEQLGYNCGPAGVAPSKKDTYIVRPIMNLYGMGIGTREVILGPEDADAVEPGYFWCEKFEGVHRSIDYGWIDPITTAWSFEQKNCLIGEKRSDNQFVFKRWYRDIAFKYHIPPILHGIPHHNSDYRIEKWNLELVGPHIIEVHLRGSPDPDYDEIVPVFEEWQGIGTTLPEHRIKKYKFIRDEDTGGGRLKSKRIGFFARNYL